MLDFNHGSIFALIFIILMLFNSQFAENDIIYEIPSNLESTLGYYWPILNESVFRIWLNNYIESGTILTFKTNGFNIEVQKAKSRVTLFSNAVRSKPIFVQHKTWHLCEIIFTENLVTLKLNEESRILKVDRITIIKGFNFGNIYTKSVMVVGCAKNPTWNNKPFKLSYNTTARCSYAPRCPLECVNAICSYIKWNEIGCVCKSGYEPMNATSCQFQRCGTNICKNGGYCVGGSTKIPKCICVNGFSGRSCSCPPQFCYNGGICYEDELNRARCECQDCFFGKRCLCTVNFCYTRGDCIELDNGTLTCRCFRGNRGANCLCHRKTCNFGGMCTQTDRHNYKCDCRAGYWGYSCSCYRGICGQGRCIDKAGVPECICKYGFSGNTCLCSSSYCQNNGTCVNKDNSLGCRCLVGFSGPTCGCSRDICFNNGVCVELENQKTKCRCQVGYSGVRCGCLTGFCKYGKCVELNNGSFVCACYPGYSGLSCKCFSGHCRHRGICSENGDKIVCSCSKGYYGRTCGCSIDFCHKNGFCYETNGLPQCICNVGYTGVTCSCHKNYCMYGGKCVERARNPICICSNLFRGSKCQYSPNHCNYFGKLDLTDPDNASCQCYPGYYGKKCGCKDNTCMNNGTCKSESSITPFKCNCVAPYFGTRCLCHSSYCGKTGKCYEGGNGDRLYCLCPQRYFGAGCLCHKYLCPDNADCVVDRENQNTKCICKSGYYGPDCVCNKDYCFNKGKCQVDRDTKDWSCNCTGNYKGPRCLCSNETCLNGGSCEINKNGDKYTCKCQKGYIGLHCQLGSANIKSNLSYWYSILVALVIFITIALVVAFSYCFFQICYSGSSSSLTPRSNGFPSSIKLSNLEYPKVLSNLISGDNNSNNRRTSQRSGDIEINSSLVNSLVENSNNHIPKDLTKKKPSDNSLSLVSNATLQSSASTNTGKKVVQKPPPQNAKAKSSSITARISSKIEKLNSSIKKAVPITNQKRQNPKKPHGTWIPRNSKSHPSKPEPLPQSSKATKEISKPTDKSPNINSKSQVVDQTPQNQKDPEKNEFIKTNENAETELIDKIQRDNAASKHMKLEPSVDTCSTDKDGTTLDEHHGTPKITLERGLSVISEGFYSSKAMFQKLSDRIMPDKREAYNPFFDHKAAGTSAETNKSLVMRATNEREHKTPDNPISTKASYSILENLQDEINKKFAVETELIIEEGSEHPHSVLKKNSFSELHELADDSMHKKPTILNENFMIPLNSIEAEGEESPKHEKPKKPNSKKNAKAIVDRIFTKRIKKKSQKKDFKK